MVISHISHHQTHREYFYCQTLQRLRERRERKKILPKKFFYLDCKLIPQRAEPLYNNVIAIVGDLNFNLFSGCQGQGIIFL